MPLFATAALQAAVAFTVVGDGIPQPRGVRLLRAITLSDISRFNPNVTTVVSDVTEPLVGDTLLNLPKAWMPDRPFGRLAFDIYPEMIEMGYEETRRQIAEWRGAANR